MKKNNKEEGKLNKNDKFRLMLGISIVKIIGIAVIIYIIFYSDIINTKTSNVSWNVIDNIDEQN